jgi:glutamate 5-kinase
MSDIDGFYTKDPKRYKDARLIKEVDELNSQLEKMAGKTSNALGTGGMASKINAIKTCMRAGVKTVICNGSQEKAITKVLSGQSIGTLFVPKGNIAGKKLWILEAKPKGAIFVDEGAKKALLSGKNLLAAGVVDVRGNFGKGDVVDIDCSGIFAKAIVDFSSSQISEAIKSKGSRGKNITRKENFALI